MSDAGRHPTPALAMVNVTIARIGIPDGEDLGSIIAAPSEAAGVSYDDVHPSHDTLQRLLGRNAPEADRAAVWLIVYRVAWPPLQLIMGRSRPHTPEPSPTARRLHCWVADRTPWR